VNPGLKVLRLPLLCLVMGAVVGGVRAALPVRLSEVASSNAGSLKDENGDSSDWIEIQNSGASSVDLAGCGLSDRVDQPFKWVFQARTLSAGGFLVVFASGKNRTTGSWLHTNFSIGSEGEEVVLTGPDGSSLDAVPRVRLRQDMSYAREASGDGAWRFFTTPTPGAANTGVSFAEVLGLPPTFSTVGGFHSDPVSLALAPAEPGTMARNQLNPRRSLLLRSTSSVAPASRMCFP
jgi:hypothetical protein